MDKYHMINQIDVEEWLHQNVKEPQAFSNEVVTKRAKEHFTNTPNNIIYDSVESFQSDMKRD